MYGSKNREECEAKSTKIHLCDICNEQFTSKMLLNCHWKETHNARPQNLNVIYA